MVDTDWQVLSGAWVVPGGLKHVATLAHAAHVFMRAHILAYVKMRIYYPTYLYARELSRTYLEYPFAYIVT